MCLRVGGPSIKRCHQADNEGMGRRRTLPSWYCFLRDAESMVLGQGLHASWDEIMSEAWDLFIKIVDMVLRLLNAAFFLMIAWYSIKEWRK
jgi:hypothetical protein